MISKPVGVVDKVGLRVGDWQILAFAGQRPCGAALWLSVCVCGTFRVCSPGPSSLSCGCRRIQTTASGRIMESKIITKGRRHQTPVGEPECLGGQQKVSGELEFLSTVMKYAWGTFFLLKRPLPQDKLQSLITTGL